MKYKLPVFGSLVDTLPDENGEKKKQRAKRRTMYKATYTEKWVEVAYVLLCLQQGMDRGEAKKMFDKFVTYPDGYRNDNKWSLFKNRWDYAKEINEWFKEMGLKLVREANE